MLKKTKFEAEVNIGDFLQGVVCVMVDEVHQAKADVLKTLLTGPFATVPIRWGLTGTIPKEDYEMASLQASLGEVINKLSASELQDKGVLANCHVNVIQTQETNVFSTYASEQTHLVTNQTRLQFIADLVDTMRAEGNTLILVDRIKTGQALEDIIVDSVFIVG